MANKVPLGKAVAKTGTALCVTPKTMEERLAILEAKMEAMTEAFYAVRNMKPGAEVERSAYERVQKQKPNENSDGIPLNTVMIGVSYGNPYMLTVMENGYLVKNIFYQSLSAAAEAVSGCRRSGWTFWKLPTGVTAKEAFKNGQEKE